MIGLGLGLGIKIREKRLRHNVCETKGIIIHTLADGSTIRIGATGLDLIQGVY